VRCLSYAKKGRINQDNSEGEVPKFCKKGGINQDNSEGEVPMLCKRGWINQDNSCKTADNPKSATQQLSEALETDLESFLFCNCSLTSEQAPNKSM